MLRLCSHSVVGNSRHEEEEEKEKEEEENRSLCKACPTGNDGVSGRLIDRSIERFPIASQTGTDGLVVI